MASIEQRRALGAFIRAQRSRLAPATVGVPPGGRRRTPGLRREEVAQLCGLSPTWYTWIEQGRDVSMSPAALARLARALRLSRAERAYLFELSGRRDPEDGRIATEAVPPAVLECLAAMSTPAYLLDRTWTACGWNRPAERLFAGWLDRPGQHNLLRFIFLQPEARSLICDWPERARRVVAEFRAACGTHLRNPALDRLVAELTRESPAFAAFWDQHAVLDREGGERTFNHPIDGFVRYQQTTFAVVGHPELQLTMLVGATRA